MRAHFPTSESDLQHPEPTDPTSESDRQSPEATDPTPESDLQSPEATDPTLESDLLSPEANPPTPESDPQAFDSNSPGFEPNVPTPEPDPQGGESAQHRARSASRVQVSRVLSQERLFVVQLAFRGREGRKACTREVKSQEALAFGVKAFASISQREMPPEPEGALWGSRAPITDRHSQG